MRLEGSLDAFSLPDIFSLLSMTKKTGGLHLRRADAHGVVWLGDGLITGGASNLSRLGLGRRLAGSGHIADSHLSAAVDEVSRNPELGLARALRDSRAIDEGELHSLVTEHVVDTVFDLMRWPDGAFEFVMDEGNIDDIGVARQVDEVVTEARHRLDIWSAIDERVANPATVLSLAVEPDGDPQLARDEWALLSLIDGRRTVGELVMANGRGEYAVVVALAELFGRGLLRANDADGADALLRRQDMVASLELAPSPDVAGPARDAVAPSRSPSTPLSPVPTTAVILEPTHAPIIEETVELIADPMPEPVAVPDAPAAVADAPAAIAMTLTDHIEESAGAADAIPAADDSETSDAGTSIAQLASLPRSVDLGREIASVTPQRPEPFLAGREPDHPEPLAAVAGGGAVVAAMPAGAIERDPSVNKSLLLRLIAGVRGL